MTTLGYKHSLETRRKISKAKMGKPSWRKGIVGVYKNPFLVKLNKSRTGKSMPKEAVEKSRLSRIGRPRYDMKGESNHHWKGGISNINRLLRGSIEYKLWRQAVFERDNFTCLWCGQLRGEIEADHIKSFASYPELRFAIDNGRTLCHECHKKTDTYLWKARKKK